jgi:hypothetical protein
MMIFTAVYLLHAAHVTYFLSEQEIVTLATYLDLSVFRRKQYTWKSVHYKVPHICFRDKFFSLVCSTPVSRG